MIFGARTIFQRRAVDFSFGGPHPFFDAKSIDLDRSTARGAQKRSKFTIGLQHVHLKNRRIFIFGARTIFLRRAVDSSFGGPHRFFDAKSMDLDRSTARGGPNRSGFTIGLQHVHLRKSTHFYFRGPNNFSTARR